MTDLTRLYPNGPVESTLGQGGTPLSNREARGVEEPNSRPRAGPAATTGARQT
jgi:hypothetical protein